MSLSKQLFILITLMFVAILAVNYWTGVNNIRGYLEVESEVHAQDTATSLGLSLSPHMGDPTDPILETMINAIFDRGYYKEIRLEDAAGEVLVRKTNPKAYAEIPEWFLRLMPMQTAEAGIEISSGWNIAGAVFVTVHPGNGYLKLWEQAKRALYYSLAAFLLSALALAGVLQLVLRPLSRINGLALSIAEGVFGEIRDLPWTLEIRNVAQSMNLMSRKIGEVINGLRNKLHAADEQLHTCALTGLDNRERFDLEMKEMYMAGKDGHVFLVRIDELGELAKERSEAEVQSFLLEFGEVLREGAAKAGSGGKAFRFFGSEFAMVVPDLNRTDAERLAAAMGADFAALGPKYGRTGIAHLGGAAFHRLSTSASVLAAALESLEKAKLVGDNTYTIADTSSGSRDLDAWRDLVREVIENRRFEIELIEQVSPQSEDGSEALALEEAVARIQDADGKAVPIGIFVSVAEEIGMITAFDHAVLAKAIEYIERGEDRQDVAVNLSFTSMASIDFRAELFRLLQGRSQVARRLVFTVTAYGAAKDIDTFNSFAELVHRNGAKVMIKRYEPRFIELDRVNLLRPDYIRLARAYTDNIAADEEKRRLVEAVADLGRLLDIRIIAESVRAEGDMELVLSIGLFGASRGKDS